MHFRNAASNLGMLGEARKWAEKQPIEYHKKKHEEWKKRLVSKDYHKHVVLWKWEKKNIPYWWGFLFVARMGRFDYVR